MIRQIQYANCLHDKVVFRSPTFHIKIVYQSQFSQQKVDLLVPAIVGKSVPNFLIEDNTLPLSYDVS